MVFNTLLALALANDNLFEVQNVDISAIEVGWGTPHRNASIDGNPLKVHGAVFSTGLGVHANSAVVIKLNRNAERFTAKVGVDDEVAPRGSVKFVVYADNRKVAESPLITGGTDAFPLNAEVKGAKFLKLVVEDGGDGDSYDHADWLQPTLTLKNAKSKPFAIKSLPEDSPVKIAPVDRFTTRINGPSIVGCTPHRPFIFRIPVSGQRPLKFQVSGLPVGLHVDLSNGVVSGMVARPSTSYLWVTASGKGGTDSKQIKIVAGSNMLALTPPMGWNSWNVWAGNVDSRKVRAAADSLLKSGLADYGYAYVNIDDTWEGKRDANGEIQPNEKFKDISEMGEYVHSLGLKLGIYSSPGPTTCGGYAGSWQHERQDAETYAKWGVDYLKYDWCSYGEIAPHPTLDEMKKPYLVMRNALDLVNRDIVFSYCQYGMGDVYKWGKQLGGNLWRTTGDINDSWASMSSIGFSHSIRSPYAGPGGWNDPDMLVVGRVGWGAPHPSKLKPNEQVTHITLWSMLAAPLIIGCDMDALDDLTKRLLMNPEVVDVDQDELGQAAVKVWEDPSGQVWTRSLADGSKAVALFNLGSQKGRIRVPLAALGFERKGVRVRDLWQRSNFGLARGAISREVPAHGAILLKLKPIG